MTRKPMFKETDTKTKLCLDKLLWRLLHNKKSCDRWKVVWPWVNELIWHRQRFGVSMRSSRISVLSWLFSPGCGSTYGVTCLGAGDWLTFFSLTELCITIRRVLARWQPPWLVKETDYAGKGDETAKHRWNQQCGQPQWSSTESWQSWIKCPLISVIVEKVFRSLFVLNNCGSRLGENGAIAACQREIAPMTPF